jgi:hypothetical protein
VKSERKPEQLVGLLAEKDHMKISLDPDYLRTLIPDYTGDIGFWAELDSQNRLVICTSGGGTVTPIAVARWSDERNVLEARSGLIHSDPVISEQVYEILTNALASRDAANDAKVAEIIARLAQHGLPPVPGGNLPRYLENFPDAVKKAITEGMRAVFLEDLTAANRAFQEAASLLSERIN